MDAVMIFKSVTIAQSIAAYFGLIDTVGNDVKKLLHAPFNSAKQNLQYAENASGENQLHYIREAQDNFVNSLSLESNENLISAYIGVAMCQWLLGDRVNAKITISKIKEIGLSKTELAKYAAMDVVLPHETFLLNPLDLLPHMKAFCRFIGVKGSYERFRIKSFEDYKNTAINLIKEC